AKTLNCQDRKVGDCEPCGKCSSCQEITNGNSLDLIEIDAASHRGIDDIRELRDGIKYVPSKSKYKVFIIDECHQLSKDAANALLKTLEEPPAHAIFILATTELHKMLPTILSRCQRFDFRKLKIDELVARLRLLADKENAKIDDAALELIAINAGGSVRDAESFLGQVLVYSGQKKVKETIKAGDIRDLLGIVEVKFIGDFVDLLILKKASPAVSFLNSITDKGFDLQEFNKSAINYFRQGLIMSLAGLSDKESADLLLASGLTAEEFKRLKDQAGELKIDRLRRIIELFLAAQEKIRYSPIPQLPLELAIIEACEAG
ncbi:MAG: DNA polymerase III subunit gamma/tau, partial [Candidatus Nealsonbacteria bacterium]|nr:DNA polymerase III subunit gamma/tau [Candidatus Nealsonbacteria bacterium]